MLMLRNIAMNCFRVKFPLCSTTIFTYQACNSSNSTKYSWNLQDNYYRDFIKVQNKYIDKLRNSSERYVLITKREERTDSDLEAFKQLMVGKYKTFYRGLSFMKSAYDATICQALLSELKPQTIIELGSFSGASALFMYDYMKLLGAPCKVYSMDIDLTTVHANAYKFADNNIQFIEGDVERIEKFLPDVMMRGICKPLLVVEDCHCDLGNVLEYFDKYMTEGDYFIVDDTSPQSPTTNWLGGYESEVTSKDFIHVGKEKLNEMKFFLSKHRDKYAVDTFYTDFYGYNVCSNWDGYIRKMKNN